MKLFRLGVGVVALGLLVAIGGAYSIPYWFVARQHAQVDPSNPSMIERGRYVARAADCVACHTAPGGKDFAGGLGMQTPMGTIYSTNITPDKQTGIGRYDYADFERAVRQGFRPDGTPLYPAMPFVSYAVVTDADVQALYAYFMSDVRAVAQENQPSTIPWPLSMRWPLAWWQVVFAGHRTFDPPAGADAATVRGAYLVEGLAHCGACHTPRGLAFQEEAVKDGVDGTYLSGSVLEGWYAKDLRNEAVGLANWSQPELVDFLKTGRNARTAAFGSMVDVVEHSTQHLNDADLSAIATYLKSRGPRPGKAAVPPRTADATTAHLLAGDYATPGALAYVAHCAACHRLNGEGAARIFPALAGNSIVAAENPSSLIQVTLTGSAMAQTSADRMAFVMPALDELDNRTVADVLTFIRSGWGNSASAVAEADVAAMRDVVSRKAVHFVPGAVK